MRPALVMCVLLLLAPAVRAQAPAALDRQLIDSLVDADISSSGSAGLYERACHSRQGAGQQVVVGRLTRPALPGGAVVWVASATGVSSAPTAVDSGGRFALCGLVLLGRGATLFGAAPLADGRVHLMARAQRPLREAVVVHHVPFDPPPPRPIAGDGARVLVGQVLTWDGRPLADARITLDDQRDSDVRSDAEGTFTLALPAALGDQSTPLTVRALQQLPTTVRVSRAIASATIVLEPTTPVLDQVQTRAGLDPDITGFETRRAKANGATYITGDEIRARRTPRVSQVLRGVPGLVVDVSAATAMPQTSVSSMRQQGGNPLRPSGCTVSVWMDGALLNEVRAVDGGLDFIDTVVGPHEVRGIEVHRSMNTLPPTFARPGSEMCGAILIWTRRR